MKNAAYVKKSLRIQIEKDTKINEITFGSLNDHDLRM